MALALWFESGIIRFRRWLVPIVNAVLEEFEQIYHHLLHCFPDVSSLVESVARIEEIQRVSISFVLFLMREAAPILD